MFLFGYVTLADNILVNPQNVVIEDKLEPLQGFVKY